MAGQPKGLFDVSTIEIFEPAQPGFPPTLLPAKILDAGDPFSLAVKFNFNNPPLAGADPNSGWIFGFLQWLQCGGIANITYTVTYTAEAMDSANFYNLGSVSGNLTCSAGGSLNLNYSDPDTRVTVAGGIPANGVYKLIATVSFNAPGIIGYAEDVIQVHAQSQI
ncbi:hypothetical protein Lepto7375DRAFT_6705 [Leptolyngbya sp. PCC 7375]|nr:hypothetical protein Lepto7375DRAFT_6705 [Leptolyngbya sp. PCC 7375]